MKKKMAWAALAAAVITGSYALVARAEQPKLDICHHADTNKFVHITIADPAWPAHQEHGDLAYSPALGCDEPGH